MLFTILKSICHLFGDNFANAMRFAGYAYLVRKHGHDAQIRDIYPEDDDDDPPPDNKNDNHIRAYNLYKIDQEHEQDLTTSLGDLLDEATEEHDFSFFSDMTPEQLGKMGWTWEVGKGMVRKPRPCCPECHQELWWE